MILLLDNYDSFVHNLARYLRRLGCQTEVIRSDQIDSQAAFALQPDGIVISPGPHGPADAGCSVSVVVDAPADLPILGVCLGHQSIAAAFGGRIIRCEPMHGLASTIEHDGEGVFAQCQSPMRVGRYHSLAIDPRDVPGELIVTARSTDDDVIMGVRHKTRPVFGVQFHPESVLTDDGLAVLDNFVDITRRSATHESTPSQLGRGVPAPHFTPADRGTRKDAVS
ncbi:anthranilate synthase component II [Stieleria varia]|uniref:Aminodeoxychorismate/anthranilate synthase component 2 n=1 Tax=Stieleria varia TaxID=2528005 RepID=A0A5C6B802_9BACT|nr:aminodeoxychorismate/anthranilate synthase component II [Stieleria varia]TWU07937.1 Aminodeoxychorismate/anthranilate synthase component 2 [Stieleria varia]